MKSDVKEFVICTWKGLKFFTFDTKSIRVNQTALKNCETYSIEEFASDKFLVARYVDGSILRKSTNELIIYDRSL